MKKSGALAKYSPCAAAEIGFVRFCTFSKEQLQAWSVMEVTEAKLYEGTHPMIGGPNDLRLGVNSMSQVCQTCGQSRQCQGHFGHIKLAQAVYHYGFLGYVQKVLRCICHNCSRLKTFTTDQQKDKFTRINRIIDGERKLKQLSKLLGPINQCIVTKQEGKEQKIGCGCFIPTKIVIKQNRIIVEQRLQKNKYRQYTYTAQRVKNIFAGINYDDAKLLGFIVTKPVDLLISSLAVAPPQIRPRIQMNAEKKAQDDITITYMRIISLNNQLKNSIQSNQRSNKIVELQRLVASIMVVLDRNTLNMMENSNKRYKKHRKIKSVQERLKSKEGRFRQHLMGKRVDFSARTVISPDSNLALDELGVPEKIANCLTIPQKVTEWNFDKMIDLCKRGKVKYILRPTINNKRYEQIIPVIKLCNSNQQIQKYLSYGTIVERNLQNGDYVLFNRQPTLHRMSMMAHRVRILPYNTFRLNLSVCTPYNADFDGDQMNMHVPQSFQTQAQLKCIAHVPKQIIAPKNSSPVMGMVQDALLGMYLLTMRDTFLTREEAMNLIIWIQPSRKLQTGQLPVPALIKPECLWTGKQIIGLLIPSQISLHVKKGSDGYRNIQDTSMLIRYGQLLSGALQREVVGSGAGGLIHALWLELGPQITSQFITNAQRVVNCWLMTTSFSVGVADVVTGPYLQDLRVKQSEKITKRYFQNINKYRDERKLTNQNLHQKGKKILNSLQCIVNMELNNSLSIMQKILSEKVSSHKNNIYKMITAKSKGSQTNLAQIMFCLGNQNVDGQRVPLGFSQRALPHFRKNDNSPEPRGFVFSSFYQGLKPHQFFFHSMGGRQGLSDTAVKTSNIGYIQRKLVKSLEDLVINYDGTVRDSQSNFLQKLYGEDGFLSEYIERHKSLDCLLSEQQFRNKYSWEKHKIISFNYKESDNRKIIEEFEQLNRCRIRMREIFIKGRDSSQIEYYCPIQISRLIQKIKNQQKPSNNNIVKPKQVIQAVESIINQCIMPRNKLQYEQILELFSSESVRSQLLTKRRQFQQQTGIEIFHMHLKLNLASKIICEVHKLDKICLQILVKQIKSKFQYSIAPAGEAIGAVAAQSIGQPTTQMTLNTFHLAGVSDRNVTLGIPRLRELLDVSKRIKTPFMNIFYKSILLQRQKQLKKVTDILALLVTFKLPEKHIKDYMIQSKIYYDPYPEASNINAPVGALIKAERRSPWVLSLLFDTERIANTRTWTQIKNRIQEHFELQFQISEKEGIGGQLMPNILMRCFQQTKEQLKNARNAQQNCIFKYLNSSQAQIKQLFVSGIKGIKTVKISKRTIYNSNTSEDLTNNNKMQEEIMFQAEGTNLKACLCHPDIDCERTVSNDINQIFELLGIEAARKAFINEFQQILKPYSIYINHRHLSVLADWMSTRGFLTPINRNGINRVRDVSVLRKASFQQTIDILFGAAAFSQIDQLRGVSQRIIFGQNVNLGTNSFQLILDRDRVSQFKYKSQKDRIPLKQQLLQGENLQSEDNQLTKPEATPKRQTSPYISQSSYMKTPISFYNKEFSPSFATPLYSGAESFRHSPQASPLVANSPLYYSTQSKSAKLQDLAANRLKSPLYSSPYYHSGQSSLVTIGNFRSPLYNTPIYPSKQQTSPEYSPINYSNSPIYGPLKKQQIRSYSKQQQLSDDQEDDD